MKIRLRVEASSLVRIKSQGTQHSVRLYCTVFLLILITIKKRFDENRDFFYSFFLTFFVA